MSSPYASMFVTYVDQDNGLSSLTNSSLPIGEVNSWIVVYNA